MKSMLFAICLLIGGSECWADDVSGPHHTTIKRTSWGSIFYDPVALGTHKYDFNLEDIRIKSSRGEVRVVGSENSGYRLICGDDVLTVKSNFSDVDIRWKDKSWSLKLKNSRFILAMNAPKDTVVFDRNANSFTIKGDKGFVTVNAAPGEVSIKSSVGQATLTNYLGSRSFSGVALDQIPYFGRGVYISFHGVGVLIDMIKIFPVSEVAEWIEWKPMVGLPFDPNAF